MKPAPQGSGSHWQRNIALGASLLLLAVATWIAIQYARDADEITRLKRYSPHGHHFIDTAMTGGAVKWNSREIAVWRVRQRSRELASVADFKTLFLKVAPDKRAVISVHHPALNLNQRAGRESFQRAEAILAFLTNHGYTNAGEVSN